MLSWIGNIFICIGLYLVGNKVRQAFIFSAIGEFCWMVL